MSRRTRRRPWLGQLGRHCLLAAGAIVMLVPFAVMARTAFTAGGATFDAGLDDLTLDNFRQVWAEQPWLRYYGNGVAATALIFVGQVALCLPAGYALARRPFAGRGVAMLLVAACLVIPEQVTALPNYVLLSRLGWLDSLPSLVLPFVGSAFAIFLFRQFILTIPQSLFDAARLDGVRPVAMVWRVVLPNVRPAILALGVFSVVSHWNDLFWPSVVLRSDDAATVPYAIATYATSEAFSDYGVQMAAAALAVLPLLIAFVAAQRQVVRGISLHVNND